MANKNILLVFILIVTVAYAKSVSDTRLVGGTPTTIERFPYIAAYVYYYPGPQIYIQRCVGTIISQFHVLTTAFCFTGANLNFMLIRAGSTSSLYGGILSTILEVIKHPDYVETPRQADIAVTVLNFPLPLTNTIGILYLPPHNWFIPDGQTVKIVSWGFESEQGPQMEFLKTVDLNKLPLAECQEIYENSGTVVIDDPVICASQPEMVGVCLGDSGAPMAIDSVVVGLSSYFRDCGNNAWPDVFTRIDRYTNWILEVAVAPGRSLANVSAVPRVWEARNIH